MSAKGNNKNHPDEHKDILGDMRFPPVCSVKASRQMQRGRRCQFQDTHFAAVCDELPVSGQEARVVLAELAKGTFRVVEALTPLVPSALADREEAGTGEVFGGSREP